MAAVNAVGRAAGLEPLHPQEQLHEDARARELYERHSGRVLAYCRSRLRRREDAEDAVQTTFLHAVGNLRRGDTPSHELAWLLGIARNVCLSRLETAGRRGRLELVCDPVDLERSEAPGGRRDELIGLEDALARLPEQQRRAVLLRDWRGLTYEEVASQLGVSLANAETLIFRGRRSLAAMLEEHPAATRRRLASLGNGGSLLAWVKASLGGAAASKLAAAAVVVAISGAGVAAGSGALDREPRPAPRTPAQLTARPAPAEPEAPAASIAPSTQRPASRPPGARASSRPDSAPTARAPAGKAVPRTSSPHPPVPAAEPAPEAEAAPDAASRAASPDRPSTSVPPVGSGVAGPVDGVSETIEGAVPAIAPVTEAVTETVVGVVESVPLPQLPVEPPPVVETVVAAVPPVTVGPITADPPKLLPRP